MFVVFDRSGYGVFRARRFAAASDSQLMTLVQSGSPDAFEELYDRYGARAYRVAQSVCRDKSHAEDAVQEAFIAIWRSAKTYQASLGSVAAWLLTLVRYRALDSARRNTKHASRRAAEDLIASLPAPGDVLEATVARDDADRLHALLERLPDAQREVITLAFYGELTYVEIATRLSLPLGTVKGRARLGLQKLRAELAHAPEGAEM